MTPEVFLGFGSNISDRLKFINTAASYIRSCSDIEVVSASSVYETEPWGVKNQNNFFNCVLNVKTSFSPVELLNFIKDVEVKTGRKNRERWYEREIDIDVLFFNDLVLESGDFCVPHKEVVNRRFVLVPMCEVNSKFVHPVLKKSMSELLEITKDNSKVVLHKT